MSLRAVVRAPEAAGPRLGLIAAALNAPAGESNDWERGFTYRPEACGGAGVSDPCSADQDKEIPDNTADVVEYDPFYVWAGDKCTTMDAERDWQGLARRLLEACESQQIEAEFWAGAQALDSSWPNRFLASPEAAEVGSGLSPVFALAALEDALGSCACGARGMIHATRGVVTLWQEANLIERQANLLLTALDTVVVPGSGYDGSGPQGEAAADGAVWAYATGMVTVRRSDVQTVPDKLSEAVNRATNLVEYRAERLAAASWDGCCHVAVEIDAPAPPVLVAS